MAPAASNMNPRSNMNLLMDIFLLLVMGAAGGLCWASGPRSSARSERRDNGGMLKSANENLARRSRVQRRAAAARVALQHPRGHARIRPVGLALRADRVRQQFHRPHGGDREDGGSPGRIRTG